MILQTCYPNLSCHGNFANLKGRYGGVYDSILLDTNKQQNNLKPSFLFTDDTFFIGYTVNAILSKP